MWWASPDWMMPAGTLSEPGCCSHHPLLDLHNQTIEAMHVGTWSDFRQSCLTQHSWTDSMRPTWVTVPKSRVPAVYDTEKLVKELVVCLIHSQLVEVRAGWKVDLQVASLGVCWEMTTLDLCFACFALQLTFFTYEPGKQ
jgi:hypothetical protein